MKKGDGAMGRKESEQGKKCFIITPIGDSESEIFRKAKGVIESVIKPVLQANGFNDIKPAYEINVSGTITTQIISRIINDDLVIANLTGNNPNVMYELCLRHVVAKPIIHICENGTSLPFDIKDSRTVFYKNDMLGVEELKKVFVEYLSEIDYKKEYVDNPIYNSQQMDMLLKSVPETEGKNIEIELLRKIYQKLDENFVGNYRDNCKTNVDEEKRPFDFFVRIPSDKTEMLELIVARILNVFEGEIDYVGGDGDIICFKENTRIIQELVVKLIEKVSREIEVPMEIVFIK